MKKLFLVAFATLFALSAFAEVKTSVFGRYVVGGYAVDNPGATKDVKDPNDPTGQKLVSKKTSMSFLYHYVEIWGSIEVENFKAELMINPIDGIMGTYRAPELTDYGLDTDGLAPADSGAFDLIYSYATWTIIPGLSITGGRVHANEYEYKGAFSGYYNTLFREWEPGEGIIVAYDINKENSVFIAWEKYDEAASKAAHKGKTPDSNGVSIDGNNISQDKDSEGVILGANLKFGDVVVQPRLSYVTLSQKWPYIFSSNASGLNCVQIDPSNSSSGNNCEIMEKRLNLTSLYVGGGFNPAKGPFANGAVAFTSASGDENAKDLVGGFGVYLNGGFAMDMVVAGVDVAYSSYSSKKKDSGLRDANNDPIMYTAAKAYRFGGMFDRTVIIDQNLNGRLGGHVSVPAMTTVQLYADITPIKKLTISPRFAYYLSNVKKDEEIAWAGLGQGHAIGNKTTMMEIDLVCAYSLTDFTKAIAGVAYASFDKFGDGLDPISGKALTLKTDAVMAALWKLQTDF